MSPSSFIKIKLSCSTKNVQQLEIHLIDRQSVGIKRFLSRMIMKAMSKCAVIACNFSLNTHFEAIASGAKQFTLLTSVQSTFLSTHDPSSGTRNKHQRR